MSKNLKYGAITGVIFLALTIVCSPLRGIGVPILGLGGIQLASLVEFVLIFGLFILIYRKWKDKASPEVLFVGALIGVLLIPLTLHILYFQSTLGTLLNTIITLIALILAYFCAKLRSSVLIVASIGALALGAWLSIYGNNMWRNSLSFGTPTGKISDSEVQEFEFYAPDGTKLSLAEYQGKYQLVYCWTTSCGYCYKSMPEIQELFKQYKNNDRLAIYSLHSIDPTRKETTSSGDSIIRKRGYTFPVLATPIYDITLLNNLRVRAYPTTLVFDPEQRLIYRGKLKGTIKLINKTLK